jgi:hypothetical protein
MATITTGDSEKTVSLTLTDTSLGVEDAPILSALQAMDSANTLFSINTIVYASEVCTIALRDGRNFVATFSAGMHLTVQYVSADFWTVDQYSNLIYLASMLKELVDSHGLSEAAVAYA